jgi:phage tail P2-like protein
MENSVLGQLAQCYRDDPEMREIADALTRSFSDLCAQLEDKLNNYETLYLDPNTCDPLWLDSIAFWCGWGEYWDSSWSVSAKRQLLTQTEFLWSNRGNKQAIALVFQIFGLDAKLEPASGFILSSTQFTGSLNADAFNYRIRIPSTYYEGSPERTLINRLVRLFLPCWLTLQYVVSS